MQIPQSSQNQQQIHIRIKNFWDRQNLMSFSFNLQQGKCVLFVFIWHFPYYTKQHLFYIDIVLDFGLVVAQSCFYIVHYVGLYFRERMLTQRLSPLPWRVTPGSLYVIISTTSYGKASELRWLKTGRRNILDFKEPSLRFFQISGESEYWCSLKNKGELMSSYKARRRCYVNFIMTHLLFLHIVII